MTSSLGAGSFGIAFDGSRIWTANTQTVSIVSLNPISVTTFSTGFSLTSKILYDGSNIWVTDHGTNTLLKLNADGSIAQSVNVGNGPIAPVFDGTNIWVPNRFEPSVTVVRVKDAAGNPLPSAFVLATLTGNGLDNPVTAAFDGERILITNINSSNVSLWKADNLTPLGSFPTFGGSLGACSDDLNFWITINPMDKLARF